MVFQDDPTHRLRSRKFCDVDGIDRTSSAVGIAVNVNIDGPRQQSSLIIRTHLTGIAMANEAIQ